MHTRNIELPEPVSVRTDNDGLFFFLIHQTLKTGGRYRGMSSYNLDPLYASASVAPITPTTDDAVCMVRSVEWLNYSFYLTFEVVYRTHWLLTGELKPWEGPIDICYAFHGRLK
jgi:hypothetical protein